MHKPSNTTGGKNVNKTLHNVNSATKEMDKQTVTTQRNQKPVTMHSARSGPSTHQVPGPAKRKCNDLAKQQNTRQILHALGIMTSHIEQRKTKASQKQHKPYDNGSDWDLWFCAETQWQKIGSNNLVKKNQTTKHSTNFTYARDNDIIH